MRLKLATAVLLLSASAWASTYTAVSTAVTQLSISFHERVHLVSPDEKGGAN